jgi:hypothetical protein
MDGILQSARRSRTEPPCSRLLHHPYIKGQMHPYQLERVRKDVRDLSARPAASNSFQSMRLLNRSRTQIISESDQTRRS